MHIVINCIGKIVIYDLRHIRDIQTATSNIRRNHHWGRSPLETFEGIFTFTLILVTVNATGRKSLRTQHILDVICRSFRLDKNQNQTIFNRQKEVHESTHLFRILHIFNSLRYILACASYTSDRYKDIIIHKVTRHTLHRYGKCRTKHHRLSSFIAHWHILSFNNATNLRFKTHIQHTICFIQYQEANILQGNTATFNKIHQSSRCGD
mmetsp:Transcript_18427/g.23908  ORF Transcript_18427/g.23908 Transcript_18427/m.23908 type:complete len:208 (-) Transcript_18427:1187-1810(-)